MAIVKSIGAYFTFLSGSALCVFIMMSFRGLFELAGLGNWMTHGGSLQVCVVSTIAAYCVGCRDDQESEALCVPYSALCAVWSDDLGCLVSRALSEDFRAADWWPF